MISSSLFFSDVRFCYANLWSILTGETEHALGQGKYQVDKLVFKNNKLTGSEIRYTRMNSAFAKKARGRFK
jgi:hypothetical protein